MSEPRSPPDPAKRVLIVSHSLGYNGELLYFGEIFAALRKREPGLVIATDAGVSFANPHGLDLRPMFRLRRHELGGAAGYDRSLNTASPMLARDVARLRPDVLVTIEFTPVALLAVAGSLLSRGTRRVVLVESDPAARGGGRSKLARALKRWSVARAHAVLTNNEAGRRYCLEELGVDPARLLVGPYLTSRPPGPEVALNPAGKLRLLFVNSLTERKNAALIIAALALVPDELRHGIELTIVGDGPERATLESAVAAAGLSDQVHFTGRQGYAELHRHYASADVLLNPTRSDYRSLSSFEGLGYGLALLVSDADGAARESVVEGETGFTFPSDDAAALASHIQRLAQDRDLLARMRRQALALYKDRFSIERAADNIAAAIARAREAT